jgi:hypothetical protein
VAEAAMTAVKVASKMLTAAEVTMSKVLAAAEITTPACMAASPASICVSPDRATIATELPGASGDDSPASPATATVAHTGAAASYRDPSTAVNTTTPHGIAPTAAAQATTTAAEPTTAMRDNHAATAAAEATTTAAGAAAPCFGNGYGDHEAQTQGDAHDRCCLHSSHNSTSVYGDSVETCRTVRVQSLQTASFQSRKP